MIRFPLVLLLVCLSGCWLSSRITDGSGTYNTSSIAPDPVRGKIDDQGRLTVEFKVDQVYAWNSPYVPNISTSQPSRASSQSQEHKKLYFNPSDFELISSADVSLTDQNQKWLTLGPENRFAVTRNKSELPIYYYYIPDGIKTFPSEEAILVKHSQIYWFKPNWQGLGPAEKLLFKTSQGLNSNSDLSILAPLAILGDVLIVAPLTLVATSANILINGAIINIEDPDGDGISCQPSISSMTETQEIFDPTQWATATTENRVKMFIDLGDKIEFSQPNRVQILSLLGPGDSQFTDTYSGREYITMIKYYHKQGRRVPTGSIYHVDPEAADCLTLRFYPSGLLKEVKINGSSMRVINGVKPAQTTTNSTRYKTPLH